MLSVIQRRWLGLFAAAALFGATASSGAQSPASSAADSAARGSSPRRDDNLFHRLDKNHDRVIDEGERTSPDASRYAEDLKRADRDGNGRVTQEEFRRLDEVPMHRNPKTAAAFLLILGFACFCMFVDGLLEPERRDYFIWSVIGTLGFAAGAYLFAADWFIVDRPYLAFVAVAPALVIVAAILAGATKEIEMPESAQAGPVVYKVGKEPPAAGTAAKAPRRPTPPVRTPRPAPVPRPPVPERRPAPSPPRTQPPRPQPPKPPGPPSPGAGPKQPPGKS